MQTPILTPTSNNGLESNNMYVTEENTLKEQLSMNKMLYCAKENVENWSKMRMKGAVHAEKWSKEPILELSDWTDGFNWMKANSTNCLRTGDFYYTLSSTMKRDGAKAEVNTFIDYEAN